MSTAQPNDQLLEQDIDAHVHESATESGLDENVAGALSYVLGPITGIIMYLLERENAFVRFHAAQSIAIFGLLFVANFALGMIGTIVATLAFTGSTGSFMVFSLLSLVVSLVGLAIAVAGLGLWVYLMIRTYQGKTPRIPVAAGLADRLV